jgi:predicted DNA-binding transcriptional regulator AlpA
MVEWECEVWGRKAFPFDWPRGFFRSNQIRRSTVCARNPYERQEETEMDERLTSTPAEAQEPLILLRGSEAASLCRVSRATWNRWIRAGKAPSGIKIEAVRLWQRKALMEWIEQGMPPVKESIRAASEPG